MKKKHPKYRVTTTKGFIIQHFEFYSHGEADGFMRTMRSQGFEAVISNCRNPKPGRCHSSNTDGQAIPQFIGTK